MILAKTDYAIIFINTQYTYLTAPMAIIYGMYTQNPSKNNNIYINLHIFLSEVTEVNYRPWKVTRGKKFATLPKNKFSCMYPQTPIRSHIGYVRLITDVIGGHYRSHKVKNWFSKEVENMEIHTVGNRLW